jgi:large-conductance mechanosensitive channel
MNINDNIDNIQKKIYTNIIESILNFINKNYSNFINFLISNNVIGLTISIILGIQLGNFTNSINNILLKPIIDYIDKYYNNSSSYNLFGIKIEYGKLLLAIIDLSVALIIIYLLYLLTTLPNIIFLYRNLNSNNNNSLLINVSNNIISDNIDMDYN